MTGEGFLDPQSFSGKVVGGVIEHVAGRVPILCVVGDAAPGLGAGRSRDHQPRRARGEERARTEVLELIEEVVSEYLSARA